MCLIRKGGQKWSPGLAQSQSSHMETCLYLPHSCLHTFFLNDPHFSVSLLSLQISDETFSGRDMGVPLLFFKLWSKFESSCKSPTDFSFESKLVLQTVMVSKLCWYCLSLIQQNTSDQKFMVIFLNYKEMKQKSFIVCVIKQSSCKSLKIDNWPIFSLITLLWSQQFDLFTQDRHFILISTEKN